jgi:hypothetical protein
VRLLNLARSYWTRSTPVYCRAADDSAGLDDVAPGEPHSQIVMSGMFELRNGPIIVETILQNELQ